MTILAAGVLILGLMVLSLSLAGKSFDYQTRSQLAFLASILCFTAMMLAVFSN